MNAEETRKGIYRDMTKIYESFESRGMGKDNNLIWNDRIEISIFKY